MNSFLIRRLAPIFIFAVIIEALDFCTLTIMNHKELDLHFLPMVKTAGVLLLTTMVSFLYLILPYVCYLMLLPARLQNSPFDKLITIASFTTYVFFTLLEETLDIIFWKKYGTSVDYEHTSVIDFLHTLYDKVDRYYSVLWLMAVLAAVTLVFVVVFKRFLFTNLPIPSYPRRIFEFCIYIVVCGLAYMNIDISKLEINANNYNNQIAKEGTFNLIKVIDKQEITPSIEKIKEKMEK